MSQPQQQQQNQYDFVWSNSAKSGFSVLPQTKDTSHSSLTITGRGSPNWGRDLQENLLWILESFASDVPPAHPTTGQLWYDTVNKKLHVYDASQIAGPQGPWLDGGGNGTASGPTAPQSPVPGQQWWNTTTGVLTVWDGSQFRQLYPVPYAMQIRVASHHEYNAMADLINQIIATPTGSTLSTAFGWSQTNTIAHETGTSMTNAKWVSLLTQFKSICDFLGVDLTNLTTFDPTFNLSGFIYGSENTIGAGIVTVLQRYSTTLSKLQGLGTGTARFTPVSGSLESSTPAGGTVTRSTAWSGTLSHDVITTFADAASMKAYFNSGGQIQIISTLANPSTGRDFDFQSFLNTLGTVKFRVNGTTCTSGQTNTTGFYDLTSSYQLLFSVNIGNDTLTINGKLDSDHVLRLQVIYSNPGSLYGGVGGTLTSAATLVRASSTILNSPIIAYPVATSVGFY